MHATLHAARRFAKKLQRTGALQDAARSFNAGADAKRLGLRRPSAAFTSVTPGCAVVNHNNHRTTFAFGGWKNSASATMAASAQPIGTRNKPWKFVTPSCVKTV